MIGKGIYSKEHRRLVQRLIWARKHAGLDQIEVAKQLKKSQSHVSKLELGERRIEALELRRLANIYNKSINYFLP